VIARNDLGEPIFATPAVGDGVLYVRTAKTLWGFSNGVSLQARANAYRKLFLTNASSSSSVNQTRNAPNRIPRSTCTRTERIVVLRETIGTPASYNAHRMNAIVAMSRAHVAVMQTSSGIS